MVRQGTLTPSPAGSNPAVPARITTLSQRFVNMYDPVAQSAEQLPFKQWVRGSNPRRVTNSSQATYRLRRVFYVSHKKLISRSFCCSSFSIRNHCVGLRIESGAFFVPSGDENPGGVRLPPQRRFGAQPPRSGGAWRGDIPAGSPTRNPRASTVLGFLVFSTECRIQRVVQPSATKSPLKARRLNLFVFRAATIGYVWLAVLWLLNASRAHSAAPCFRCAAAPLGCPSSALFCLNCRSGGIHNFIYRKCGSLREISSKK